AAAHVAALAADGTPSGGESIGEMWGDIVLGEHGTALAATYLGSHKSMVTPIRADGIAIGSPEFLGNRDVTSMVAEAGGGFVTGLSTGQIIGSDASYDAIRLTPASPAAEGSWVGMNVGGDIAGIAGPRLVRAETEWGEIGAQQRMNQARLPAMGIWVKARYLQRVYTPFVHTCLVVVPALDFQSRHEHLPGNGVSGGSDWFVHKVPSEFGTLPSYLSTGSVMSATIGSTHEESVLGDEINESNDVAMPPVHETPARLEVPTHLEEKVIRTLFELSENYYEKKD